MNIEKILAPVNFSISSAVAIAYASELGRLLGASIHALHVMASNHPARKELDFNRDVGSIAMGALEQLVNEYRAEGYSIRCRVRNGRPVDEIIAEAEVGDYDLIVMGTRCRNRVARFLRPSTTDIVIRRSRCPVVAVRDSVVPEVAKLAEILSMPDIPLEASRNT